MELREIWALLKRRWLVIVIPTAVVLAVGLITYRPPGPLYNAGVRFIAGQAPVESEDLTDEQRLANWKTSEYIVNTLADWVHGGQFAALVSQELSDQGITVAPPDIVAGTASDSTRSMMVMSMNYGDAAVLEQMLNAASHVLLTANDQGLPQLGGEPADLVQLDQPIVNRIPPGITTQLQLPLRIALALAAGLGLALLADYLDPTVRGRSELEALGLPVIAEIPRK